LNVRFACPACAAADRFELPRSGPWRCVACGHAADLRAAEADGSLRQCALCGNAELYRQKDFPQWIGLSILTVACSAFFVLHVLYHQWIAWAVLLGSAAIDGLLYYGLVGDVMVCYRCGCQHRGVPSRSFDPHELAIGERYRQERLRQEQLKAADATRRDAK
jgi:Zn ribbon nucleic-acid-binding protein